MFAHAACDEAREDTTARGNAKTGEGRSCVLRRGMIWGLTQKPRTNGQRDRKDYKEGQLLALDWLRLCHSYTIFAKCAEATTVGGLLPRAAFSLPLLWTLYVLHGLEYPLMLRSLKVTR